MKTVIFRPTNNCNLACTYCYDKNNHDEIPIGRLRTIASEKLVSNQDFLLKSFEKIFDKEKNPSIIFHGGEPLLIKTDVLDSFCDNLQNNLPVSFSIQTNGTLIDDKVIDLFKKHNFRVGISLDGCCEELNAARVFPSKVNSFNLVYKNLKILQEANVKHGIIMSINRNHIGYNKEIYDFIGYNKFSCNIRPVFASSQDEINSVLTPEEYAEFFNNLFDIWFDDKDKKVSTHQILEIYQALKKQLDPTYIDRSCDNSNDCFRNFIAMDVEGELYACNRLYGINKFHYGNLSNQSMDDIYEKADILLKERNDSIKQQCGQCEELKTCSGGCPAESYDIYQDLIHPSPNCKVKQLVKKHVKERVE